MVYQVMMNAMSKFESTFDAEIIDLFKDMRRATIPIHRNLYLCKTVLRCCGNRKDHIALDVVYRDFMENKELYPAGKLEIFLKNEFIVQYLRCDDLKAASRVLDSIPVHGRDERTPKINL